MELAQSLQQLSPFPSGFISFNNMHMRSTVKTLVQEVTANDVLREWNSLGTSYWLGKADAESFFNANINRMFSLRIKSINYLVERGISLSTAISEPEQHFDFKSQDEPTKMMFENMGFALRAFRRSMALFLNHGMINTPSMRAVPPVSFEDYASLLSLSIPPEPYDKMLKMLFASLKIEISTAVISVFKEQNIKSSDDKILNMAEFVRDAGQEFGAVVRLLLPTKPKAVAPIVTFTDAELKENFELAELGLKTIL